MPHIASLDLGTTTLTCLLVETDSQQVLHVAGRSNDSALQTVRPTRREQDPRRLLEVSLALLAQIADTGEKLDAIALTGQMHGLLCVGRDGHPLTPLIDWQDRRTSEPVDDDSTTLDEIHARLEGLDWRPNGCRIAHGYGMATLYWLTLYGRLPPGTHQVCSLPDWLGGQLCGQLPVTSPSLAASWGAYGLEESAWNRGVLARLDLDARYLPAIRPAGQNFGSLDPPAAARTGLYTGTPVLNAIGDNQASFLGSVGEPGNAILLNLGTGGQVCWAVPGFESPSRAVETRPLPGKDFLRVGASLCGGAAYAWLNRTVRSWLAEFGAEADTDTVYERLNALAWACDDTEGLRVRTTFLGSRSDPAVEAGSIEGVTLNSLPLGKLARATLQGIVDELYDLYTQHGGRVAGHSHVVATGGGVRQNRLMPAVIAEKFGMAVTIPDQRESAALGAALLAGEALTGR